MGGGVHAKILVIDDEPVICDVLADCLQDLPDTEVRCALTGMLGAEKLRTGRFDLALIDVLLPEISGLELTAIAASENTAVLLLSGHPETNEKLEQFGYP